MPTYSYSCQTCDRDWSESRAVEVRAKAPCPECGAECPRVWRPGAAVRVMEVLDNGLMGRRLERDYQIGRLVEEREIAANTVGDGYHIFEKNRRS